jgi:hypothetical protein
MLRTFVVLAGLTATIASNHCEHADSDTVALLQSALEEKRSPDLKESDAEADEYNLAGALKCKSEKLTEIDAPFNVAAPSKAVLAEAEPVPSDPPGAETMRAALKFMCLLVILDSLRRLCSKKEKASGFKQKVYIQMDEAALESNWVELVKAAQNADDDSFKKVPEHPALLTRTDAWGCTALHFAAVGGSTTITSELVQQGAKLDAVDADQETALHFAARAGNAPICDLLVSAGAEMNAVNSKGFTPLVVAAEADTEDACRILADRGAGVAGLTDEELPPRVISHVVRKVFAA